MNQACTVQCAQCPFRPTSLRGWLGNYTSGDIFQTAWFNQPFYCHTKINYANPRWKEQAARNGRICLGFLVFANSIKAPLHVDDRADLISTVKTQKLIIQLRKEAESRTDVVAMGPKEFSAHHRK